MNIIKLLGILAVMMLLFVPTQSMSGEIIDLNPAYSFEYGDSAGGYTYEFGECQYSFMGQAQGVATDVTLTVYDANFSTSLVAGQVQVMMGAIGQQYQSQDITYGNISVHQCQWQSGSVPNPVVDVHSVQYEN